MKLPALLLCLTATAANAQRLPTAQLARQYYGQDAAWYQANIPFFEIDDAELQQTYYYRWQLYRAHLRDLGPGGYTVTEFLPEVPWGRPPATDLNDSSSFHLLEGRWLRDPRYMTSLIDHLYTGAGNDRHFSESIAAATYAVTQVTGDPAPALRHLDTMQYVYNAWGDHFDRARNLYWIEPLLDATEYTISSIDASGAGFTDTPSTNPNQNGFTGGYAYRPTINAYQYANARAIAELAREAGQPAVEREYNARAERLRRAVEAQLWNPALKHYTDVYQRSTKTVTAGQFIRGRELAGMVPWAYMPNLQHDEAWPQALAPDHLAGPFGLRTVEPTYARYMRQYRYEGTAPECQWNGPSWPFQTSQVLTGLAAYIASGKASVSSADYLRLLRQYAHQHYLTPGHPDLQEDYNPDTGAPIVGLARSHHYNHSTFNDLIFFGLAGIHPSANDRLDIRPILDGSIHYFALEGVEYHGHTLAMYYDRDGSRYHLGAGLTLFVDGSQMAQDATRISVTLAQKARPLPPLPVDLAGNPGLPELAQATASSSLANAPPAQALDGRLWFYPEIANGWSPVPGAAQSTFEVRFPSPQTIATLELSFFADGKAWALPNSFRLEVEHSSGWESVPVATPLLANTPTRLAITPTVMDHLRLTFINPAAPANLRLVELKAYAP